MIHEDQKIFLHNSLTDYGTSGFINYSGVKYTGYIYRANDSFDLEDPCIIISWIPTGKKTKFVSKIRSSRPNRLYHNYGYIESEMCILTAFAEDSNGMRGRRMCDGWLYSLETYIKNNWNTLISGVGLKLDSFTPYREVPEFYSERLYGLETRFEMQSHNIWTDEPVSGVTNLTDISGVSITKGPVSGVTGMINVWVI